MSYIKAEDILPEEVIELIQQYVDGESIYIPRKAGNRLSWGCNTEYRAELHKRNERICLKRVQGASVHTLAQRYHLSEKSIRRILRRK